MKGFKHKIRHNLAIDNYYADICFSRCYPSSCAKQIFYNNNNSVLEMNAGGFISAFAGKYQEINFGERTHDITHLPPNPVSP